MSAGIVIPKLEDMPSRMRTAARALLEVGADLEYLGGLGLIGEQGRRYSLWSEALANAASELESQVVEARR